MRKKKKKLVPGEGDYYYIDSEISTFNKKLSSNDKNQLDKIINVYSKLFFVELFGYFIFDRRFKLWIKINQEDIYTDEVITKRLIDYYGEEKYNEFYKMKPMNHYRQWLGSVPNYMSKVRTTFSKWYNKSNNRCGGFWNSKYKYKIYENEFELLDSLVYSNVLKSVDELQIEDIQKNKN